MRVPASLSIFIVAYQTVNILIFSSSPMHKTIKQVPLKYYNKIGSDKRSGKVRQVLQAT